MLVEGGVPEEKIAVVYDGVPLLGAGGQAATRLLWRPPTQTIRRKGAALAMEAARLAGVELRVLDDLERDLPHAAVFVYITHSEGLGSGALLAMSAGVPVVASHVGGLPEVIRHGENGLLVENDARRHRRGHPPVAGRPGAGAAARRSRPAQTVMERFTVDHMVRRTMEVYHQVLS